jgi:hypothetical protein
MDLARGNPAYLLRQRCMETEFGGHRSLKIFEVSLPDALHDLIRKVFDFLELAFIVV